MKNNLSRRKTKVDKFEVEVQKAVRNLRKKRGLTQKQLGSILNVDQATISNFESGKTVMSITQMSEMQLVFGNDFSSPYIALLTGKTTSKSAMVA